MSRSSTGVEPYNKGPVRGTALSLRVHPRSSRRGFLGFQGESPVQIKWGVGAAPADGKANEELLGSVAAFFEVSRGSVVLLKGKTARLKVVVISGLCCEDVLERLNNSSG